MLNPNEQELVLFIQTSAANLPVTKRIKVYRGLADSLDAKEIRDVFSERARILEEADRRCRELDFNFKGGSK